MKYNIGDIILYGYREKEIYGIIIDVHLQKDIHLGTTEVYQVLIQGNTKPVWVDVYDIRCKAT